MQQRELATVAEGARALYVEHVEGGDMEPVSVRRGGAGKPRKRTGSGQGAARKKGRSKRGDYFDDDEDEDWSRRLNFEIEPIQLSLTAKRN